MPYQRVKLPYFLNCEQLLGHLKRYRHITWNLPSSFKPVLSHFG